MENSSNREKQYSLLSDIGKDLLNEIYQDKDHFIKMQYVDSSPAGLTVRSDIHPLEPYIINYDDNMDNEGIIRCIGDRIGFNIDYDPVEAYPMAVQFYDRCSYTIRHNTSDNIENVINMTPDDFKVELSTRGFKYLDSLYLDRLNISSHKYNKKLIKSYYQDDFDTASNIIEVEPNF